MRGVSLWGSVAWMVVAACNQAVAAATPAPTAAASARQGYSIFRETLVDLSWPEVKAAAEADALVIVPVGVVEEHGPHMSLGADVYQTVLGCRMLKRKLEERQIQAVIAPPMYWGILQAGDSGAYPGSFGVQPATMKALLADIFANLKGWGFRHVYVANLHGDRQHRQTIEEALAEARQNLGLDVYDEKTQGAGRPRIEAYRIDKPFRPDYHAGAVETREMLEHFPEEVNVQAAQALKPQGTFQPLGYVGDPANYDTATGRVLVGLVDSVATSIATWLKK